MGEMHGFAGKIKTFCVPGHPEATPLHNVAGP